MSSILAQNRPSPEQEPAVTARGVDVVVTAGAGTGKTHTLVARYLSLLSDGLPLREIVAITFTRKAAREMRNRVRSAVQRHLASPDVGEVERQQWRNVYRELDAARIDTIHSLCSEILRAHPAEAGVDPRFDVLDEAEASLLREDALEEALAWAADDPEAVRLFGLLGEAKLREYLKSLLGQRLDAEEVLAGSPYDIGPFWQAKLDAHSPGEELNHLDEEVVQPYPALRSLVAFASRRYADGKRKLNALDYDDLEQGALRLVRDQKEVRAHWQQQVQAILLDEYQDTNARQRDLANLLNGGRGRMFVVGDAKQSIYRFRGADVSVFRAERQRVQRAGGRVVDLKVSYRAHSELVQALNSLLGPILGAAEDVARPWVEPFAPLECHRREPAPGFRQPHVELHLGLGSKAGGALDRAADAVAARVAELVEMKQVQVWDSGRVRPMHYGDAAILCRASSSFVTYENALERAGLPFVTVAGAGFYDRPEIRDLLNALQALADPTDDLALAGLLRSPAFALSDIDLYRLSQEQDSRKLSPSLWEVLHKGKGKFDKARAQRAAQIIGELHELVGRVPVADVLKTFLDATHYRAALLHSGLQREARNVAKLLSDAQGSDIVGVGALVEYVRGLRDVGAREAEARTPAEGAIQIMSVHQAKGLEFHVVVIGDAGHETKAHSGVLIDRELGIVLPVRNKEGCKSALYELAASYDRDKDDAESDRLLYVAATRAREKLIVSGNTSVRKDGRLKLAGWLGRLSQGIPDLAKVALNATSPGASPFITQMRANESSVVCCIYGTEWRWTHEPTGGLTSEVEAVAVPPPLLRPVTSEIALADERTKEQERGPGRRVWRVVPWARRPKAPAWVVGKLVHEALAQWRLPTEGFEHWAEARARGYGVMDAEELRQAARDSRSLLERFASHPLFGEMDRAERRLHEVPYSREADGRMESGVVDALYLRDGQWTIVEFKTDELRDDAALQDLLDRDDYYVQMRRYAKAVEHLVGQRPRTLLCLLNFAGRVELRPGEMS